MWTPHSYGTRGNVQTALGSAFPSGPGAWWEGDEGKEWLGWLQCGLDTIFMNCKGPGGRKSRLESQVETLHSEWCLWLCACWGVLPLTSIHSCAWRWLTWQACWRRVSCPRGVILTHHIALITFVTRISYSMINFSTSNLHQLPKSKSPTCNNNLAGMNKGAPKPRPPGQGAGTGNE